MNPLLHADVDSADISVTGELLSMGTDGRKTVSVSIEASVASDFALDVDLGDGTWVAGWSTYSSSSSVSDTVTVAADRVRVRNTTAQTSGDTADVKLAATE